MHDQHLAAIQVEHFFFGKQGHAARTGKTFTEQKITVAVNKKAGERRNLPVILSLRPFHDAADSGRHRQSSFKQVAENV